MKKETKKVLKKELISSLKPNKKNICFGVAFFIIALIILAGFTKIDLAYNLGISVLLGIIGYTSASGWVP